jgi:hypothetical protein
MIPPSPHFSIIRRIIFSVTIGEQPINDEERSSQTIESSSNLENDDH